MVKRKRKPWKRIVLRRFLAGESMEDLARFYGFKLVVIENMIRQARWKS